MHASQPTTMLRTNPPQAGTTRPGASHCCWGRLSAQPHPMWCTCHGWAPCCTSTAEQSGHNARLQDSAAEGRQWHTPQDCCWTATALCVAGCWLCCDVLQCAALSCCSRQTSSCCPPPGAGQTQWWCPCPLAAAAATQPQDRGSGHPPQQGVGHQHKHVSCSCKDNNQPRDCRGNYQPSRHTTSSVFQFHNQEPAAQALWCKLETRGCAVLLGWQLLPSMI